MVIAAPAPAARSAGFRTGLRVAAGFMFLGCVGFWAAKGAHTGWSQNQVPVKQTDEITGIQFVTYEKRFVPGVEFLAAGTGLAAGLLLLSFLVQRNKLNPSS